MPKPKSSKHHPARPAKKQPAAASKSTAPVVAIRETATPPKSKPAAKPVVTTTSEVTDHVQQSRRRLKLRRNKPDVFARSHTLPSVWQLSRTTALLLGRNWKLFGGLTLLYALFSLILVRGFGTVTDFSSLQRVLETNVGLLSAGFGNFFVLLGKSSESSTSNGDVYQTILFIMFSLATVWALRQIAGGTAVRIRDTFYQGMYPLVPVLGVLTVMFLQLVPLILSSAIFSIVLANGIASQPLEYIVWGLLSLAVASISVYWLTSSIFALYIAALPDMTPFKALRSARGLVRYRRWTVIRKNIFLPIALFVIAMVVTVPVILLVTPAAPWLFFILTMASLPVIHAYLYTLYRELLI